MNEECTTVTTAQAVPLSPSLSAFEDWDGNTLHRIELHDAGATVATLTTRQAQHLASELTRLTYIPEPIDRGSWAPILSGLNAALGTCFTLEDVAAEAGVDLETASRADEFAMSKALFRLGG